MERLGRGHLSDLGAINKGLGALMHKLHAWGKEKFGNITRELVRLRNLATSWGKEKFGGLVRIKSPN
jgi:hypothetical protein